MLLRTRLTDRDDRARSGGGSGAAEENAINAAMMLLVSFIKSDSALVGFRWAEGSVPTVCEVESRHA